MYALIAAIPILMTVVFMAGFNWPAKRALPVSWAVTCVVAGVVWKMGIREMGAQTVAGFLSAFETLCIIFGAILLMNVLKQSGAMTAINHIFSDITKDARIQTVIVGYAFGGFIEGIAGFGTPAALAAPILISLGFPPLAAASVCLIYNSTAVCPGPVGIPTITGANMVASAVKALGGDPEVFKLMLTRWTCIPHMIGGVVIIFVGVCTLCKVFGKNKSLKDALPALPFSLFAGVVIGTIYVIMAWFTGPELTTMTAFLGALPILIFAAKKGFLMPKEVWTFEGTVQQEDKQQTSPKDGRIKVGKASAVKAWMPYVIISILLVLSRVEVFGIKAILNNDPFIIYVDNILGCENVSWQFKFLWNPGIMPFLLVAVILILFHRMSKEKTVTALKDSVHQISGAAIALLFGVAMVNLYRFTNNPDIGATIVGADFIGEFSNTNSSMLYTMAYALANIFSGAYFIVAPVIGVLGAFMSGSCTVSNTLFASLQFETATLVGLSQVLIVALQNMGGAIGNMICVNNTVAVCATTGTSGNEGKLIRINLIPTIIYCVCVIIVTGILLAAGVNPMPEIMG